MENILDLPEPTNKFQEKNQKTKRKEKSLIETTQQRNVRLIITFCVLFVGLIFIMWLYSSTLTSDTDVVNHHTVADDETILLNETENENVNLTSTEESTTNTESDSVEDIESTSDTVSVDELLLMPIGEDVYVENGTFDTTTIKPGYYTVTTTGMARLMITGEDGSLVTLTTLGNGKSCSKSYTALVSKGDTIDVTGLDGLDSVIFTPVDHKLMTEVGPGIYTAGVDILSGTVRVSAQKGYGCVSVISSSGVQRESVTLASADSAYEADGESVVLTLSSGDQLNVYMIENLSVSLEK